MQINFHESPRAYRYMHHFAPSAFEHDSQDKEIIMAQQTSTPDPASDVLEDPIPLMQQLLDNPFLLLFLGIAMPTVLYIVWGVMEIANIPVLK